MSVVPTDASSLFTTFTDFNTLVKVVAWCLRFIRRCQMRKTDRPSVELLLQPGELEDTKTIIFKASQRQRFLKVFKALLEGRVSSKSDLIQYHSYLVSEGLLWVGGRLGKTDLPISTHNPIILHASAPAVRLCCLNLHRTLGYPGLGTLEANISSEYLVIGLQHLLKSVSRDCVPYQKAYLRTQHQLMGHLPANRTQPESPFVVV